MAVGRRIDTALLVLRTAPLFLALTFGRQKVVGLVTLWASGQPLSSSGLARLIGAMGYPVPGALAVGVTAYESVFALLVAAGWLTRPLSAVVMFGMINAMVVSVRLREDPIRALLYVIAFGALALAGPGRYSVDRLVRARRTPDVAR